MQCDITETNESASTWSQRPFISPELRDAVASADILFVPQQGYADREDLLFFPSGSSELFAFFKQHVPDGVRVEAAVEDSDYRELARHADIIFIAGAVLTTVVVPIFVNVVSDYLKDRLGRRKDSATVKTSLTIHDARSGRSLRLEYDGPATTFQETVLGAATRLQEPSPLPPLPLTTQGALVHDPDTRTDPKPAAKVPDKSGS